MENIIIFLITIFGSVIGSVYIIGTTIPGGTDETKFIVASIAILTGCIVVCTKIIVEAIKKSRTQ